MLLIYLNISRVSSLECKVTIGFGWLLFKGRTPWRGNIAFPQLISSIVDKTLIAGFMSFWYISQEERIERIY